MRHMLGFSDLVWSINERLGKKIQYKKITNLEYIKWMKSILRRSDEVGKSELPITALIIDEEGRCIGRGSNKRETNNDPLGHAELIALRQASWIKNDWRFNECSIIVNLEPCTMCAAALIQARMGQVIFGAEDIQKQLPASSKKNESNSRND